MKKIFILMGLFVCFTAMTTTNSAIKQSTKFTAAQTFTNVPVAVLNTFNTVVHDVMNNWYPQHLDCNKDAIVWTRDKGGWIAKGLVTVAEGNGEGIEVIDSYFKNTGEFVRLYYNVVYP